MTDWSTSKPNSLLIDAHFVSMGRPSPVAQRTNEGRFGSKRHPGTVRAAGASPLPSVSSRMTHSSADLHLQRSAGARAGLRQVNALEASGNQRVADDSEQRVRAD